MSDQLKHPLLSRGSSSDTPPGGTLALDVEEAETANLQSFERPRRQRASSSDTRSSQTEHDYERMLDALEPPPAAGSAGDIARPRPRLKDVAHRVALLKRIQQPSVKQRHRKLKSTMAMELLDRIGEESDAVFSPELDEATLHFAREEDEVYSQDGSGKQSNNATANEQDQGLPLQQDNIPANYGSIGDGSYASTAFRRRIPSSQLWQFIKGVCCRCDLQAIGHFFLYNILRSYFCLVGIPLFIASFILYYFVGNPELDFLPGAATLAWWCDFLGRQVVTLELARLSQWLLVDVLVLQSRIGVRFLGPIVTLLCIQSKGWPFGLTAWSLWDLVLLHGDNSFQKHWFYWTGWRIYRYMNSGSYILSSDQYLRVLLSMLLAGLATSIKRFFVAVHFGRRQLDMFKPRLEKLLAEVVLVTELGSLAQQQAETVKESEHLPLDLNKPTLADAKWGSVRFYHAASDESDEESDTVSIDESPKAGRPHRPQLSTSLSGTFSITSLLERWEEPTNKLDKVCSKASRGDNAIRSRIFQAGPTNISVFFFSIQSEEASISDVLKFKRALTYMDETHPFGMDFGPAGTREECIASANAVFERLLMLSEEPKKRTVPWDVIALLAIDYTGQEDGTKKKALRKLFRPDKAGQLTHFFFIQTCDSVYKRLRYFLASVGNASVIDNVSLYDVEYLVCGDVLERIRNYSSLEMFLAAFCQVLENIVNGLF